MESFKNTDEARESMRVLEAKRTERGGSLGSRDEAKLQAARNFVRRRTMGVYAAGAAAVALVGAGIAMMQRTPDAPAAHQTDSQNRALRKPLYPFAGPGEQMKWQEEQKAKTLRTLELLKDATPETRRLFDMFQKHAFFSLALGPEATHRILTTAPDASLQDVLAHLDDDPNKFEVVFMPDQYAEKLPSRIVWEGGENVLHIATDNDFDQWLGVFLYHELSHVYDAHFGGENPNDPQQWSDGEVRAHELECRLLQQWMPTKYSQLMAEGIPLWMKGDKDGIRDLGARLFPAPVSPRSHSTASASLLACIAFEEGKQRGADLRDVFMKEVLPLNARKK